MSLDESEVHDEDDDNDNGYSDSEARDHVLDLDPEQYRNYMWELEQRLLERTESAAKSRSSFLMERRLSAGERLHHVQRVVQQQRTEQELRQHRVRDELEQKMVRAMARRNAYLEAAIENDPSRRFRRRGASSQTSSSSSAVTSSWNKSKAARTGSTTAAPISTASGATTTSTAPSTGSLTTAPKRGTPSSSSSSSSSSSKGSSSMIRSKLKRDSVKSSKDKEINENNNNSSNNNSNSNKNNIKYTSEIQRDENGLHGQGQGLGSPKNSPFNMTQSRKAHLTNMTSVSSMSSSSSSSSSSSPVTLSPSSVENVERGGGETRAAGATFQDISKETGVSSATDIGGKARLERMTLWAQRRIRQRLVEKASREYMRAIGGSHQRVLGLKFEELARLLHTNKGLIQATVKLLRYSSQLAQMDRSIEQQQQDEDGEEVKKNPARVFLSMYMVLAHPSQIRSPSEHAHPAHIEDDSAFESLVESSKALLEALQTWLTANTKPVDTTINAASTTDSTEPASSTSAAAAQVDDTTPLLNFDAAWTSYYNFFEAWKEKDAQRLLKTLLDHARQIEALWRTVQSDPTARAEWGLRIEEQRRDLRDKARQLAGPDGVARLDEVFADFVSATTPPALALPPTTTSATTTTPAIIATPDVATEGPMETNTEAVAPASQSQMTEPSSSSSAPVKPTTTTPVTKKRQRLVSISNNTDSAMDVDGQPPTGTHVVHPSTATTDAPSANMDDPTSTGEEPQPKKPFKARVPRQPVTPAGFEKQDKWSNLQLIHELALDPNFKIESKRVGGDSTPSDGTEEGTSSGSNLNSIESLESRIRAMATKAYFDKIREDAEQGQLGKWIPPLLTTIREQLLDMVPQESSVARQIRDGFDLEFVQQQVDRKVYDVKGALEGVLGLMAKLCAPVRDPAIRHIQQDLSLITGNPLQQTPQAAESGNRTTSSPTSATPKDLVSVLKDILELLEEMLMDLANYRLMVARPSLEKQAIPYEQHAFKTALENGEITLDATTAWLETSTASLARASAISTTTSSGSKDQSSPTSPSSSTKTNRHYEVYINAVLDLLYSKTPLELWSKEEFPETFVLDQARLTRYQNELQALALIAVMWNISLNVQPPLRDEGQQELKQTLFRLMESADTSKETLAEAIIEAKEKALLLTSRSSASSTRSISSVTSPTSSLLLSADQKSYLRNTIERAISFDSSLYSVLSQRIRKVLESYLLSSPPGLGSKPGVMPEQAELNKVGLGAMAKEIETFAAQIGLLIRYNAKVYQPWYDPLLTKILPSTSRKQRTPTATVAAETRTSAPEEATATSTTADKVATPETELVEGDKINKSASS
ncbi:hypothetical protein BGZ89_005148 [Linnemannia elongata]|nr:hypothetical protein BGZ89_005148 [Linnemannia elongata]